MVVKPGEQVILWGDSLGKGVVWNADRGRYGHAETSAAQVVSEELRICINNRSRFGSTAPQGLELMERDLNDGLSADAAVIEFGGNDCNFDWAGISDEPDANHDPVTLPEQYMKTLRVMVSRIREHGIRPILITLPPINAERYFQFLIGDKLNPDHVLRWLGDVHRIYRFQEMYSAIAATVAYELDVGLLDLRRKCLAVPDFITKFLCADGLHMNENGQLFTGQAVIELVRSSSR